jgi:WD40 repeat protein
MHTSIKVTLVALACSFSLATRADDEKSVSYYRDIVPLFKRSCNGCHHPGKLKGQLDLTTHAAILKGGKHGAAFKAGDPKDSVLLEEISGDEPSMPKEGEPLSSEEVAMIHKWIVQGAQDDTPADKLNPYKLDHPPTYASPAVISSLAYSPDGSVLAVAGYNEVLLHKPDGSGLVARLVGEAPRIESLAFSHDGKLLGVAASAPAVFGAVQLWDVAQRKMLHQFKVAPDSVYGISFSPDDKRAAFGGADKSVRMIDLTDGKELLKFDNHSDWVFGAAFTVDGSRLLSGSRDKAMKLINLPNGQFIDDINKLLDPILCLARHPKEDKVIYGSEPGISRMYRIGENQGRTAANNDSNLLKEFDRLPGPVHAVAFNADGSLVGIGGVGGEVRIHKLDGSRAATLKGHDGAVFAIAFHPSLPQVATAGFEGKIRIFDTGTGNLISAFVPFPIQQAQAKVAANK